MGPRPAYLPFRPSKGRTTGREPRHSLAGSRLEHRREGRRLLPVSRGARASGEVTAAISAAAPGPPHDPTGSADPAVPDLRVSTAVGVAPVSEGWRHHAEDGLMAP